MKNQKISELAKTLLNELISNVPNPDYETKKVAMALVAIKSNYTNRSSEEVQEIFKEAETLIKGQY